MKIPINYEGFHCEICQIDHVRYWLDGDDDPLTEGEVHDLLNSGHYFLKPVVPTGSLKGN